ncbi:MAG: hypothetical protein FWC95_03880 [Defluviitaleaceae bacterium]|nr:hypothetical protein [Defluviitaleaceae bacterium]
MIRNDEKIIKDALAEVTVQSNNLSEKVKFNMMKTDRTPLFTQAKRNLTVAVAAIVAFIFIGGAVTAYALGAFGGFFDRANPEFAEVVLPVGAYVVSQDIRLEVIAARRFDAFAVFYVSLQDISGQNRLGEDVYINVADVMFTTFGGVQLGRVTADIGGHWERVYFNAETNTAYFRAIYADPRGAGEFRLRVSNISLGAADDPEATIRGFWAMAGILDVDLYNVRTISQRFEIHGLFEPGSTYYFTGIIITPGGVRLIASLQLDRHNQGRYGPSLRDEFPRYDIIMENEDGSYIEIIQSDTWSSSSWPVSNDVGPFFPVFNILGISNRMIDMDNVVAVIINGYRFTLKHGEEVANELPPTVFDRVNIMLAQGKSVHFYNEVYSYFPNLEQLIFGPEEFIEIFPGAESLLYIGDYKLLFVMYARGLTEQLLLYFIPLIEGLPNIFITNLTYAMDGLFPTNAMRSRVNFEPIDGADGFYIIQPPRLATAQPTVGQDSWERIAYRYGGVEFYLHFSAGILGIASGELDGETMIAPLTIFPHPQSGEMFATLRASKYLPEFSELVDFKDFVEAFLEADFSR